MEHIWLVHLMLSFVFMFYGLVQLIGIGWALFIFDLLNHSVTSDYARDQREHPPTKNKQVKILGFVFMLVGSFFGYLAILAI